MMNNTFKVGEFNCEFPRHSRPGGRDPPGSCGASPTIRYFRARPIWATSRSSRTLKRGNVRKPPLKIGIRELIKATLLILPPAADPYDQDDRQRDADMIVIDDGRGIHEQEGTTPGPGAFEKVGIARLLARAAAVIVNAGPCDFDAGTLLVSWAGMAGQTVLIECEGSTWAAWARFVKAVNPNINCGLRIPEQVVPPDLADKIDYRLQQSTSTKH